MTDHEESEVVERHVEFGRIDFSGFEDGETSAAVFGRHLQSAIQAKHFALRVHKSGQFFILRRCVARQTSQSSEGSFTLFADLAPSVQGSNMEMLDMEAVASALREWTELAVATLLENASASSDDVTLPKRLALEFDTADLVAARM